MAALKAFFDSMEGMDWFDVMEEERTGVRPVAKVAVAPKPVAPKKEEDSHVTVEFDPVTQANKLGADILAVQANIKKVQEAMTQDKSDNELSSELESLNNKLDFLHWEFGNVVGYPYLAGMRKYWGIHANTHNALQEKYYKLQKERYEHCKRVKKFFTQEDREFIDHYKNLNEEHQEIMIFMMGVREFFANVIEAAFPDAPFDWGFDEDVPSEV